MSISNDEKITLDRGTFKALASETRVDILKKLDGTQKTVSELAREMDMNKATMYQHLEQLREAGLVKRLDGDERMTTVKSDPLEAPEAGPPRKWVYYKLTWKGKNVVSPGKVKFAVMLSIIGIISIAVVAILMANVVLNGPMAGDEGAAKVDDQGPIFDTWKTPEPSTRTTDYEFSVDVYDSPYSGRVTGLREESVKLYYGIGDREEGGPDFVDWEELATTHTGGEKYSAKITGVDWKDLGGKYLYIKAEARDLKDNTNSTSRVIYIVKFDEPNLVLGGGGGGGNIGVTGGGGGMGGIRIHAEVRNDASVNAAPFEVGVYTINPDNDCDGIVDPEMNLVPYTLWVFHVSGGLAANATVVLDHNMTQIQLREANKPPEGLGEIYFVIDPSNELREESKVDNIVGVQPDAEARSNFASAMKYDTPKETGSMGAPGFELVLLVAAMAVVVVVRARRKPKDC